MQQDIVPQKRKSIRDIPIPDGRSTNNFRSYQKDINLDIKQEKREFITEKNMTEKENVIRGDYKRSNKKIIFISLIAIILIGSFIFYSRSYANIYIQTKEMSVNTNSTISVPFSNVELSVEKNVSIKATGEEKVTEKAKGKITIYNEYEEEDQRLLKETRFESSNGLIYRIPTSVVVPGLKRDEKGNIIAGKLEVEVVADQAGEKYNIGAGKFTVPGFKDLPQYNSFYAVSNSSMTGGFDGIRKVISETDRENAEKDLKNQIKTQLISDAKAKSNETDVVIADESMITYEILGDKINGNDVVVSAKGTIKAMSINANALGNSVAAATISNFTTNENVIISNIDKIKITLKENTESSNNANLEVSGNIDFRWQNNYEAFKQAVAGVSKNDLNTVVEQFPGITSIRTEVRPVWSGSFPENIEKINIIDEEN